MLYSKINKGQEAEIVAIIKRSEQKKEDIWKIEDIFLNDEMWEKEYTEVEALIKKECELKGKMGNSASNIRKILEFTNDLELRLERLYVYANMKYYEDMGNGKYQALAGRSANLMSDYSSRYSFVEPELLEIEDKKLEEYLKSEELSMYKQHIENIIRQKQHILDEATESIMAESSKMAQAAKDVYGSFNNADLKFGEVMDADGNMTELTHGRFTHFMECGKQSVRKEAYERIYDSYGNYINTLASCYNANVTAAKFMAKMRKYNNTLEASLDYSNIPVKVYDGLIDAVREHLPLMHRYVSLRKRALSLKELHMYDVYAPLVEDFDMKISYEEAKEKICEGLAPLGEKYIEILREGYNNGWIDVYENEGKRSGAFSWGAYGTHPYVFMNYQNNLDSMFTLVHEMGHAIHTYKSNKNQPYIYSGYKIFVAEVASTCNEALLILHLIKNSKSDKEKAYLINHFMEQFKGTMFRQTMFAEFERKTHALAEEGNILTAQVLCDIYKKLNEDYFGEEMIIDERIAREWARIPHFYTPFYVYQYATGFAAAVAISKGILENKEGAVEGYMKFLESGCSDYPIEELKLAGVDMNRPEALEGAFKVFEELLEEFEEILSRQGK